MIISHNMQANFTSRQLGINVSGKSKAAERLSSGYRINRAADDAAGLSISEKMRAQIRGLERASLNAQDAISLAQTADGALNEVHDILHRIEELAVQAANDTNVEEDREAIQREVDLLLDEIDRISETTEFNTRTILKMPQLVDIDGSGVGNHVLDKRYQITTDGGTTKNVYGTRMDFSKIDANNIEELIGKSFKTTCTQNCNQIFTFKFTDATSSTVGIDGKNMTVEIGIKDPALTTGEDITEKIVELVRSKQGEDPFNTYSTAQGDLYIGHANGVTKSGSDLIFYGINPNGPPYNPGMGQLQAADMIVKEGNIYFQVGANADDVIEYTIRTINSTTIGVRPLYVMTHQAAGNTMTAVQNAVAEVSDYRSYVGAMQNRLEHIVDIDDNSAENLQAAESRIRDTDMAAEMVAYSRNSILEQVTQSMLVQANQSKQGVLKLLE